MPVGVSLAGNKQTPISKQQEEIVSKQFCGQMTREVGGEGLFGSS